jgi:hypothetical protein
MSRGKRTFNWTEHVSHMCGASTGFGLISVDFGEPRIAARYRPYSAPMNATCLVTRTTISWDFPRRKTVERRPPTAGIIYKSLRDNALQKLRFSQIQLFPTLRRASFFENLDEEIQASRAFSRSSLGETTSPQVTDYLQKCHSRKSGDTDRRRWR